MTHLLLFVQCTGWSMLFNTASIQPDIYHSVISPTFVAVLCLSEIFMHYSSLSEPYTAAYALFCLYLLTLGACLS